MSGTPKQTPVPNEENFENTEGTIEAPFPRRQEEELVTKVIPADGPAPPRSGNK
jgi:hypothetical protein